ncbi:uncharacterized protein LOC133883892 isoform X2 [Phragmites australis]|uniref:uncharacterized protein LOC133883892 isoform X2 n=1 Tax=Phragmites australis TaxID=29695 RepID=UPI002D7867DB|nr:uncharacterized protein LOC133883892 isoform X2 [Phragmites australis]
MSHRQAQAARAAASYQCASSRSHRHRRCWRPWRPPPAWEVVSAGDGGGSSVHAIVAGCSACEVLRCDGTGGRELDCGGWWFGVIHRRFAFGEGAFTKIARWANMYNMTVIIWNCWLDCSYLELLSFVQYHLPV